MISNGFVASRDMVQKHPDLLERFGRAYTKSLIACDANPALCVQAFWRMQPESRPKEGDEAKNLQDAITLVKLRMSKTLRTADGQPRVAGQFDLDVIKQFVKAMHQAGEFNTDQIPVDRIFTNALVPAFSKFDAQAVRAKALAAQ
jgi:NitT/TauT family transport system substrate-binding protein